MTAVSVIIPVYNGEKTIRRCLDSVFSQTLCDIEVIVVNDGSADNTLGVLDGITDSRLKIITTENRGQGFARNHGIETSGGKYLAFVDADDTIEPDMLLRMYTAAENEGADMVQCNIRDIYPDGTSKLQLDISDETVHITDRAEYTDVYFTPCRHSYEVCNKLIRKSSTGDLRFKDTRKYFSEDLLFNLELIERINAVTFIQEPYYNYYQSNSSHLHANNEKRLSGLCRLFCDYIMNAPEDMKGAASYTAAMVLSFSAGACSESNAAKEMYIGDEFNMYISRALKRKCKMSHRAFLTAMSIAPPSLKAALCRKYAARW